MMRVLLLSPIPERLSPVLRKAGEDVVVHAAPLDAATVRGFAADFVVSHNYRHILRRDVLDLFPGRIVNLHISLLPYNRGADPNLWSFLEDTPKGVSIHHIDNGIDTGDLVVQRETTFMPGETLATSYEKLQAMIVRLFAETWGVLRAGLAPRRPQPPGGSTHRAKDKEPYLHLLTRGWDTPVERLIGRALAESRR